MKIVKSAVVAFLPLLLAGCATTSSRLPLPPPLEYINDDPANVRFDRSSIYVAGLVPVNAAGSYQFAGKRALSSPFSDTSA